MFIDTHTLYSSGCNDSSSSDKVCRSRGGESCAYDGAMIVLQPIADAAHIVHGPINCLGNSWQGRGSLSNKGNLLTMGFTTDMTEMDIVYGAHDKLCNAIIEVYNELKPAAIFVYSTCVSGITGEDINSVCKNAESKIPAPVIPVNAPGFVGPKNLGNRIAGQTLIDYVIGTGEPPYTTPYDINLIGEYNIAGDLWLVEPILSQAGIRALSRITGNASFAEITYAHRAKLNLLVCSRALINVAKAMERSYGIKYIEASFYGMSETSRALRLIGDMMSDQSLNDKIDAVIKDNEALTLKRLEPYKHLRGKRAVLYSGGVKSWAMISALLDLGIEIVAVGTKKSTFEDEHKMRALLGNNAPLEEDVTPKNLKRLFIERKADVLVAGGRNLYLAVKEGFPFVDVNQERHSPYAGYEGLINLARDISNSIRFFSPKINAMPKAHIHTHKGNVDIDPLKHSQALGASIAFQGIDKALPIIHGAQGCAFLAKVLITQHYREPIALLSSKLFTEDVVMGSEEKLAKTISEAIDKQSPEIIGIVTTGLCEVKGDYLKRAFDNVSGNDCKIILVSTPDYEGCLETGYAAAVESIANSITSTAQLKPKSRQINILAGLHLTPADFYELREIAESFGLVPIMLPDLASLDGSRQGFSSGIAIGGTAVSQIDDMAHSCFTIAVGRSMEGASVILKEKFGTEYTVFDSLAELQQIDRLMDTLSALSSLPIPQNYIRHRKRLIDGMADSHFHYGGKRLCLALETDHTIQLSRLIDKMGARVELCILPQNSSSIDKIAAENITIGGLSRIQGNFDCIISNSRAVYRAKSLGAPLYEAGFPVTKTFGLTTKITIGYKGALNIINDIANALK
ncbi:bifunctional nitrogenase molybdenum-cofactor biosynthesis protein NifE/NifN [Candidatus Magnetoovum chiemensis]|nr:bifunctional nitrogenase molybdenum-cofactor biosynthesis protein NifE/NifN [Candidatus Magnetoovum chiemensis]